MKQRWEEELHKLSINVPIEAMIHPTEFPVTTFTFSAFMNNKQKGVVQIGAWLRDNYAIFRLFNETFSFSEQDIALSLKKYALVGKNMHNYFMRPDFWNRLNELSFSTNNLEASQKKKVIGGQGNRRVVKNRILRNIMNQHISYYPLDPNAFTPFDQKKNYICRNQICRSTPLISRDCAICRENHSACRGDNCISRSSSSCCKNKYVLGAANLLKEYDMTVTLIEHLNNEKYDHFLSENIVFLKLVDAAAVNTVIECIVRCTPIIINKLPAISELLGENYPLYFQDNLKKISFFTFQDIENAYNYLRNMDKSMFHISYFMDKFVNSEIYKNLV